MLDADVLAKKLFFHWFSFWHFNHGESASPMWNKGRFAHKFNLSEGSFNICLKVTSATFTETDDLTASNALPSIPRCS